MEREQGSDVERGSVDTIWRGPEHGKGLEIQISGFQDLYFAG